MNINQNPGFKPDRASVGVKNAGVLAMVAGQPVCLAINGTDDGLAVVLPSAAAQNAFALMYGVLLQPLAVGAAGAAQVYGFVNNLLLIRQTRSDSTGNWLTQISITDTLALFVDTVGNGFKTSGGSQAASTMLPFAFLCQTLASFASSASATSDTRTAITASVKAFIRMM